MAESFFRGQTLWDDAMAESIARYRDANPGHRVLLVVGAFHVAGRLGTITKVLARRPGDRVALLTMGAAEEPDLPFAEEDRGAGDAVLKVHPPEKEAPGRDRTPTPRPRSARGPDAAPEAPPEIRVGEARRGPPRPRRPLDPGQARSGPRPGEAPPGASPPRDRGRRGSLEVDVPMGRPAVVLQRPR